MIKRTSPRKKSSSIRRDCDFCIVWRQKQTPCDGALVQRGRRLTRLLEIGLDAAADTRPAPPLSTGRTWRGGRGAVKMPHGAARISAAPPQEGCDYISFRDKSACGRA